MTKKERQQCAAEFRAAVEQLQKRAPKAMERYHEKVRKFSKEYLAMRARITKTLDDFDREIGQ